MRPSVDTSSNDAAHSGALRRCEESKQRLQTRQTGSWDRKRHRLIRNTEPAPGSECRRSRREEDGPALGGNTMGRVHACLRMPSSRRQPARRQSATWPSVRSSRDRPHWTITRSARKPPRMPPISSRRNPSPPISTKPSSSASSGLRKKWPASATTCAQSVPRSR